MEETITNLDSYVNGYKVVSSDEKTVTLEDGVTVEKAKCEYVGRLSESGATLYHCDDLREEGDQL
jgi:hypothetical protein